MRSLRGFSLPELMISLVLGMLLLAGFLSALARCRQEFAAHESLADLQDSANRAMSVLVRDIEHAGFYGFAQVSRLQLRRGDTSMAEAVELQQADGSHTAVPAPGLPAGAHACGDNFAVDLAQRVQGSNNAYAFGRNAPDCAPTAAAGGARAGSDTLTVRHASLATTSARAGRLQLFARRLFAHGAALLFADGHAPAGIDADTEVRDVEIHGYYIANNSVGRAGLPALRLKSLTEAAGNAQFRDEEIQPGVEDLQVQFGVRDPLDSQARLAFVPPDFPLLRQRRVVAVRVWLRVRAERTESGFFDSRPLRYADVDFRPSPLEERQRRILLERTVAIRNP